MRRHCRRLSGFWCMELLRRGKTKGEHKEAWRGCIGTMTGNLPKHGKKPWKRQYIRKMRWRMCGCRIPAKSFRIITLMSMRIRCCVDIADILWRRKRGRGKVWNWPLRAWRMMRLFMSMGQKWKRTIAVIRHFLWKLQNTWNMGRTMYLRCVSTAGKIWIFRRSDMP